MARPGSAWEVFDRVAALFERGGDLQPLLLAFADELGRGVNADRCALLIRFPADRNQEFITADILWNAKGIPPAGELRAPFRGQPLFDQIRAHPNTISFEDCRTDSRLETFRPVVRILDLGSALLEPLRVRGEARGVVSLMRCGSPRPFSDSEIDLVRVVTVHAALAIDTLLATERDRRRAGQIRLLSEVQSSVARLVDPVELVRSAAAATRRIAPDASVVISLVDRARGALQVRARAAPVPLLDESGESPIVDPPSAAAEAARTVSVVRLPDSRLNVGPGSTRDGTHSALHVPIVSKQEVDGVLSVEAPRPDALGEDEEATLLSVAAILGVALDNARLFERAEREKEDWARTFDAITDMVSIHDQEFRLLRGNRALSERAQAPIYALTGRTCQDLYSALLGVPVECPHAEAERRRRPVAREIVGPDGGAFLLSALPGFKSGDLVVSVHLCEDITEERRLREQLLQSEKMSAVGQLVSGVAHELNNPLATVMGYTQLLLSRSLDPKIRQDLDRVFADAQRAAKIVQNLLTFARKHKPEKRYLGINGIIEKTLDLRAYEFRVSNIQITTDLDPDLPMTMIDFHQMQQVILNIVTNAEQAMLEAHGRGHLKVSTRSRDERLEIRFQDDGPGIRSEHLSRLFDPFFTTKPVGQGTGLGLSICDGIVKEHGGSLRVESTLGHGASFIVDLPVLQAPAAIPLAVDPLARTAPGARGRLVLVVDDEDAIQGLLVEILTRDGFQVDTAGSGETALKKIERRPYDLIISDLKMPGMSGAELYERIKEHRPDLSDKVLFTSGDTVSPATDSFLRRTGSAALLKPFTIDDLHSALGRFFPPS